MPVYSVISLVIYMFIIINVNGWGKQRQDYSYSIKEVGVAGDISYKRVYTNLNGLLPTLQDDIDYYQLTNILTTYAYLKEGNWKSESGHKDYGCYLGKTKTYPPAAGDIGTRKSKQAALLVNRWDDTKKKGKWKIQFVDDDKAPTENTEILYVESSNMIGSFKSIVGRKFGRSKGGVHVARGMLYIIYNMVILIQYDGLQILIFIKTI